MSPTGGEYKCDSMPDDSTTSDDSSPSEDSQESPDQAVDWRETLPAIEFCCWIVVLLAPFLRWVNGPPVTDDQAVIQASLTVAAIAGAIFLRICNWRRSRSSGAGRNDSQGSLGRSATR